LHAVNQTGALQLLLQNHSSQASCCVSGCYYAKYSPLTKKPLSVTVVLTINLMFVGRYSVQAHHMI